MGIFTTVSDTFLSMCSALAMTVTTVTDWVAFVLHVNYAAVTTIYVTVCDTLSVIYGVLDYILQIVFIVLIYIVDFLGEIYACLCALAILAWRIMVLFYKIACFMVTGVETLMLGLWNGGVITFQTLHQSAADVLETCGSTTDYLAFLAQEVVMFVCNLFTTVGNFSTDIVRWIWSGIGYVPAMVASFPSHFATWLQNIWLKCTMWTSYAFMGVTRETYLGVIICCLLYMFVSRLVSMMHARGMTFFSSRRRTSRTTRQPGDRGDFIVDRDFESDAEGENNDDDDDNDGSGRDDDDYDDNESEAHTELTLSDNDDTDGHSVGSESDVSLNSQTFSSEESDHDIDVQLPPETERYSLRSRSSTPSRLGGKDMSHEQYEQELERERDKRKCVVCQDANKSVLILPCKHMCLCVVCANQIVRSHFIERRVCPLCRARIERVMDVYV